MPSGEEPCGEAVDMAGGGIRELWPLGTERDGKKAVEAPANLVAGGSMRVPEVTKVGDS